MKQTPQEIVDMYSVVIKNPERTIQYEFNYKVDISEVMLVASILGFTFCVAYLLTH